MNSLKSKLTLLGMVLLAAAGCATTSVNVAVEGQVGNQIEDRNVGSKDLPQILDEQYSLLAAGRYENCRALSLVVEEVWPTSSEALSESRRLSGWATLFLYSEQPSGLTSLENEKRNLSILATASSEFSEVDGDWDDEAEIVSSVIDARLLDRQAFNAFVISMRSSTHGLAIDGGLSDRKKAIAVVNQSYPNWCQTVGLDRLAVIPWRPLT